MDALFDTQADEISNYGSDFTPDEEEILNELLSAVPITYNAVPTLIIEKIDGYGRPQGTHEKAKRTDSPPSCTPKSVQIWTPVEVGGNKVLEATGG